MDQYSFTVHQIGRNESVHTVAETLYFKPHQKYFHDNVYFFKMVCENDNLTSLLMAIFSFVDISKYNNVHIT
jgi:hypothetical protein